MYRPLVKYVFGAFFCLALALSTTNLYAKGGGHGGGHHGGGHGGHHGGGHHSGHHGGHHGGSHHHGYHHGYGHHGYGGYGYGWYGGYPGYGGYIDNSYDPDPFYINPTPVYETSPYIYYPNDGSSVYVQ